MKFLKSSSKIEEFYNDFFLNIDVESCKFDEVYYKNLINLISDKILKTDNICYLVYDPYTEIYKIKIKNGDFKNIKLSKKNNFSNLNFKDNFSKISLADYKLFFEIPNSDSLYEHLCIQVLNLKSNIYFDGFLLYTSLENQMKDYKFLHKMLEFAHNVNNYRQELESKTNYLRALNYTLNSMESKRNLKDIFFYFLTHITAGDGLEFNRAIIFLREENSNILKAYSGIGPLTYEEADMKWHHIKEIPIELLEINNEREPMEIVLENSFLYLKEDDILLSFIKGKEKYKILDIDKSYFSTINKETLIKFNLKKFLLVSLESQGEFIGLILVDNAFDIKALSPVRINSLINFSNLASLVLHNLRMFKKIEDISLQDSLTKLYNRRFFDDELELQEKKCILNNEDLSLIMIDIDYFKIYNDNNGHVAGDDLLEEIAIIFKNICRKSDYVCRYGGEEFAIILPNTSIEGAYILAEKIRKIIEEHKFPYGDKQPNNKITISLGISSYPKLVNSIELLKITADKALYKSKKDKRNTVSIYSV